MLSTKLFAKLMVMCSVAILFSCKKDADGVKFAPPLNDGSLPSAAVKNVTVVEKSGKTLKFNIQLAVFKDSKNFENNLDGSYFKIDTVYVSGIGDCAFANNNLQLMNGTAATNYSALMLMDQSGSISSTDPDNYRIDAGKIFCRNLGGSNAWVWWFSDSYKKVGDGFTSDTATLVGNIESLRNKETGNTYLFNSQIAAVSDAAAKGNQPKKALLTFSDGQNNLGSATSAQVITASKAQNVPLYNIGLGNSFDRNLFTQSVSTNGAFMYAQDAQQLISMFGNLSKLLDNSAKYYSIDWALNSLGGSNIGTGVANFILQIKTPYNYTIQVPILVSY